MNGLFNMNFMMTFLMAKDLPETKNKLLMAMSAGQSANLMAPILLKLGAIDTITELTQENTNLKTQVAALQAALKECEDRTSVTKIRAELEACNQKVADCGNITAKFEKIKPVMGQVKDLGTVDKIKGDSDTLKALLTLAKDL